MTHPMSHPMSRRFIRRMECLLAPHRRWPAIAALIGIGGLYLSVWEGIQPLPYTWLKWAPLGLVLLAALPLLMTHHHSRRQLNAITAIAVLSVLTAFMVASLGYLVIELPQNHRPWQILESAGSLWLTNVLLSACWYWRLDAGGPVRRAGRIRHEHGAFLFPQMAMEHQLACQLGQENWHPGFIDYLFLAWNSSTALSPTDTSVLSPWAKLGMMVQSAVSISILILLAARAVNILGDAPAGPGAKTAYVRTVGTV